MTNDEKANLYDELVHQGGILETENSKLKNQYAFSDTPKDVQDKIDANQVKIDNLMARVRQMQGY